MIHISEIYRSPQGEGRLTGVDSVFVRTSGCNLRCRFCDTPYASKAPEGDHVSVENVLAAVQRCAGEAEGQSNLLAHCKQAGAKSAVMCGVDQRTASSASREARHVVITGGEPMLFSELVPLCAELHRHGMHITIETAGTRYLPVHCDLMAVSPKLSNSVPCAEEAREWIEQHERNRAAPEVVRRLNAEYDCQFKFVVASPADCDEVWTYLADFPEIDRQRVFLMPMGTNRDELATIGEWLEPYCRQHGAVFCPRRHIEWFGCCRGT